MNIDFVVPWVDGSDPEWINLFNKYSEKKIISPNSAIDTSKKRYTDNGLLRYWFRGIEANAPWVRKIFFITNGQKPSWLNTNHEKICWVKHEDYIPQEYLPVFSSHPIEMHLHRIKDLSNTFVYFNDDTYLVNPIKESFFFKRGLPTDFAILNTLAPRFWGHILMNNIIEINRHFNMYTVICKNISKWFNIKYGINGIRTMLLFPWRKFSGFLVSHLPQAYLKKTFLEVWECCGETLRNTSTHRFRNIGDVNQYIFRYWHLVKGEFAPHSPTYRKMHSGIQKEAIGKIRKAILNTTIKEICLNDGDDSYLYYNEIRNIFEQKFPQKSSFELS
ncbi:Stealth CR1 domain-containing protein [Treponema primitia]|uniref:Stealth CR1 domain-containing protein n=1 Tax=Treponema primitia TaxID=88058 RepID=UPI0002554ED9|nr:Stealth CR1 domain-containing protein [Treponema primitia]